MTTHNGYKTLSDPPTLAQLHPSTARIAADEDGLLPEWVIYHELISTAKVFLSRVGVACPTSVFSFLKCICVTSNTCMNLAANLLSLQFVCGDVKHGYCFTCISYFWQDGHRHAGVCITCCARVDLRSLCVCELTTIWPSLPHFCLAGLGAHILSTIGMLLTGMSS